MADAKNRIIVAVFVVINLRFWVVALAGVLAGVAFVAPVGGGVVGREPGVVITLAGKDGCLAVSIVLIGFHEIAFLIRQAVNVIERIGMGKMPLANLEKVPDTFNFS